MKELGAGAGSAQSNNRKDNTHTYNPVASQSNNRDDNDIKISPRRS